jgi:hypothetical protein
MKARFTYWQDNDGRFLGYLNERVYPLRNGPGLRLSSLNSRSMLLRTKNLVAAGGKAVPVQSARFAGALNSMSIWPVAPSQILKTLSWPPAAITWPSGDAAAE